MAGRVSDGAGDGALHAGRWGVVEEEHGDLGVEAFVDLGQAATESFVDGEAQEDFGQAEEEGFHELVPPKGLRERPRSGVRAWVGESVM